MQEVWKLAEAIKIFYEYIVYDSVPISQGREIFEYNVNQNYNDELKM
ncbi:MAG: hypothetical protein KBD37_09285 [Burkholderiales bacterium]|nr:hypothetical protein [Burkholderiales bacterium]